MSSVPMSNVSISLSQDEFVVAETVKLLYRATIVLSGEFAQVEPKPTVLEAASRIIPGDWYVTAANRREGDGGIEVVEYSLNVRVKDSEITRLKDAVKQVNRPGIKFELVDTDYTPTQTQLETATRTLRKKIYELANTELEILNSVIRSGEGEWLVGTISFGQQGVQKNLRAMVASTMYNSSDADDDAEDGGITQKVTLTASVSFTKKIYNRV